MPHNSAWGDKLAAIGTIAAQPASGSVKITEANVNGRFFSMKFTFTAARVTVTDAVKVARPADVPYPAAVKSAAAPAPVAEEAPAVEAPAADDAATENQEG